MDQITVAQTLLNSPHNVFEVSNGGTEMDIATAERLQQFQCLMTCADVRPYEATGSHPRLSLLGLPGELRNLIYKYTFTTAKITEELKVLRTCRQVYHEAFFLAINSATFSIDHIWQRLYLRTRQDNTTALRTIINVLTRKLIKKISFTCNIPQVVMVREIIARGWLLQKVTLVVSSWNKSDWIFAWKEIMSCYGYHTSQLSDPSTARDDSAMDEVAYFRSSKRLPVCELLVQGPAVTPNGNILDAVRRLYPYPKELAPGFTVLSAGENEWVVILETKRGQCILRAQLT